jgi:hypothetical protein
MKLDVTTYGNTPAAMYLSTLLMELGDKNYARSVGKAIATTTKSVAELVRAYETGIISPKTLANCLRLMRVEVSESEYTFSENTNALMFSHTVSDMVNLISQLTRNVQIGHIKKAMRLSSIASKAERVCEQYKSHKSTPSFLHEKVYSVVDHITGIAYDAGYDYTDNGKPLVNRIQMSEFVDITTEELQERSLARQARKWAKNGFKPDSTRYSINSYS